MILTSRLSILQRNTVTKRNRGSALITALFIMTLVVIAVTAMSIRLRQDIYRTSLTLSYGQLNNALTLVDEWAIQQLKDKTLPVSKPHAHGVLAAFPKTLETLVLPITLSGTLIDEQSRFNLNNLQDNLYFSVFIHLLTNTLPSINERDKFYILSATQMWLMPYQPGRGTDELTQYYLKQKPAYIPSYQFMQSPSEFRLIYHVSADIYQALSPYLTALPDKTAINLYTASPTLLKSLGNGLSEAQLARLLQARKDSSPKNKAILLKLITGFNVPIEEITLISQYFLVRAEAKNQDLTLHSTSILKRTINKKGDITVQLIRHEVN